MLALTSTWFYMHSGAETALTFRSKGEKVTAKAHGGQIDITGITIANVDDKVRLQEVNTYFDPLEMFRQIAPKGIVNKQTMSTRVEATPAIAEQFVEDGVKIAQAHNTPDHHTTAGGQSNNATHSGSDEPTKPDTPRPAIASEPTEPVQDGESTTNTATEQDQKVAGEASPASAESAAEASHLDGNGEIRDAVSAAAHVQGNKGDYSRMSGTHDEVDAHLEKSAETVHPHPKCVEEAIKPAAGEAVVAPADSEETRITHEEMSRTSADECPFLMNKE